MNSLAAERFEANLRNRILIIERIRLAEKSGGILEALFTRPQIGLPIKLHMPKISL